MSVLKRAVSIDSSAGRVELLGVLHSHQVLNSDEDHCKPHLRAGFAVDSDGVFRAWLAVEQLPGIWAAREFAEVAHADWQLYSAPEWHVEPGVMAPTRRPYPKIDSQVKRLPALMRLHREVRGDDDRLVSAWDESAFAPRGRSGRQGRGVSKASRWRERRYAGLQTSPQRNLADDLDAALADDASRTDADAQSLRAWLRPRTS